MDWSLIINCVGLLCDVAGVLIVAKALSKINRTGAAFDKDGVAWQQNEATEKKLRQQENLGTIVIILGFALQLISNFC